MRSITAVLFVLACLLAAGSASARNVSYKLPLADVLNDPAFRNQIGSEVSFFWADQAPAGTVAPLGKLVARGKGHYTPGVVDPSKLDKDTCKQALAQALVILRKQVVKAKGNAAIGVISDFKNSPFSSTTEYDCHAGTNVVYVTLSASAGKITP